MSKFTVTLLFGKPAGTTSVSVVWENKTYDQLNQAIRTGIMLWLPV
jgi:hypothetical protein